MKKLLILSALALSAACNSSVQRLSPSVNPQPLNIILLIGDGMGVSQLSTLYYFSEEPSHFSRFKQIGFHQNAATDAQITDSAAGATAFASGVKTYNAAIGVDGDTTAQPTILEIASRQGKSTGLIATSSITHATPASFFAHVAHRDSQEHIAAQFLTAPVDYAAGGGIQFFQRRQDGRKLLDSLTARGYLVDTLSLRKSAPAGKRCAFFLAPDGMPKMQEGRGNFLPNATRHAIDRLSDNKNGFFLMVEGSQIDWGGHDNDGPYIVEEMKDFNRAVGVAMDFAEKNGNTLVIVTADHETGGLSLSPVKIFGQDDYRKINLTFSTGGHSADLIPVFAYGPGADLFMGIYQNNEIFDKMKSLLPEK